MIYTLDEYRIVIPCFFIKHDFGLRWNLFFLILTYFWGGYFYCMYKHKLSVMTVIFFEIVSFLQYAIILRYKQH